MDDTLDSRGGSTAPEFRFGSFTLCPSRQALSKDGQPVPLGGRAFDVLTVLVERAGEIVSKEDLFAAVWPDMVVEESNLRSQIGALRKALRAGDAEKTYVVTVPGRGYRFVATVVSSHLAVSSKFSMSRPILLTPLIGRDEILQTLVRMLDTRPFVTVCGPGGIGKTSLAIAAMQEMSGRIPDCLFAFVDCSPLTDPREVPSAVARTLGVPVVSEDPTEAIAWFLSANRALVVLDTCEHVVQQVARLVEVILEHAPDTRLLATSREPVRARGEKVLRLPPLETPPEHDGESLDDVLRFPAARLFVDRASAHSGTGIEFDDAAARTITEICRSLDGVPLAIELMAGQADALGLHGILAHLDDRLRLEVPGTSTVHPRHRSLEAMLEWSYALLSESERALLRRLSVFAGQFTIESAARMVAGDEAPAEHFIQAISRLISRSVVHPSRPHTAEAPGLYRMLDTTRRFARARLDEAGEELEFRRRHALELLALVKHARAEWETRRGRTTLFLDQAHHVDDLRQALGWAFSEVGDSALGIELTLTAVPLWFQLGLVKESFDLMRRAQNAVEPGPATIAFGREAMGVLAFAVSAGIGAKEADDFRRLLSESGGAVEDELTSLLGLWVSHFVAGADYRKAHQAAERFALIAETADDQADRLQADHMIGSTLHFMGEQVGARRLLERAVSDHLDDLKPTTSFRRYGNRRALAMAILSRAYWVLGLPEQAQQVTRRSMELLRSADQHRALQFGAVMLGEFPVSLLVGDLASAEERLSWILDQKSLGQGPWQAIGRAATGWVRIRQGDPERGIAVLRQGVAEMAAANQLVDFLYLTNLAEALGTIGAREEGLAIVEQALARAERSHGRWCIAELLRVKAGLVRAVDVDSAERIYEEALARARSQSALSFELRIAIDLASIWRAERPGDGQSLLAQVYGRFTEGFETADLRAARALLEELSQ